MATIAEQLHLAREARSLTIYQVAEVTKIRTDHIRALESGDFDAFSAPVYIRGFVRTYATLLKMDVGAVMAALDAELGQTEKFREPPPLSEEKRGALDFLTLQLSKINFRIALIIGATVLAFVLVISILIVWRHHQQADPLANLRPAVYQPAQPSAGETLPLPGQVKK